MLLVGLVAVGACSPQPSPTGTLSPTPTPVPGPTLSPTLIRPGAGSGDCGGLTDFLCDAVWAAATGNGVDPKLLPRIVGWRVRPTAVRTCDGVLAPKFDVTLALDSGRDVTVTVGQYPDGRLAACTY